MAEESLVEMPSPLLVNLARKVGIDPFQYERGELIDKFKQQTEDYKVVLGYKKARQANREFNLEGAANQRAQKLNQTAIANRDKLYKMLQGGR